MLIFMERLNFKKEKYLIAKTLLFVGFALFFSPMFGQVVNGTVTDATGATLPGVSVTVKGTTRGTVTDMNGAYELKVTPKSTLVFSSVGMVSKLVRVEEKPIVNVVLQENVTGLGDVVVVGYGKQRKSSLTGAVSAVSGDDLLKTPSTNVSSVLGGRLPGISSVQVSGEPGDDQASLRIRGSINSAMYIVDGIPRSINDIDPNDVESVSVLKDGAAAAVYGLDASGGVIIITTKHGMAGKTEFTYNGTFGISQNANFPKFMNGPQFAYYYNMGDMMDKLANGIISSSSNYTPIFTQDNIKEMTNGDPTDGWDNVDYIKKVFGTGTNQKHSITATGGTDKLRYYTSLGFMNQSGNIDNFNFRRYNLRSNIDVDVAPNVHMILGIAGNVDNNHKPAFNSGGTDSDGSSEEGWLSIAHQAIMMHPYLPETYGGLYTATIQNNIGLPNSPLAAIYQSGYQKTQSFDIQTNLSLQWNIPWVPGLSLKVNGSYDYESSHNKNLNTPYYVEEAPKPAAGISWAFVKTADPRGISNGINMGEGNTSFTQLIGQGSANYVHAFGKNHIDALALMEIHDNTSYSMAAYAKNLSFPDLPELSYGTATDSPISGYSGHTRSVGFVYRLKYDYADKYLAELTGRYDGSYKFSGNVKGKRWGYFPSASVAWRISKENFMENLKFLDDLKVRASIGLLGNDNVSEYSFLSQYSIDGQIVMNQTLANALARVVIANPNLTWEKTLSYNSGFDFTMWGGKLSVDFDGFYNYTYDMLTYNGGSYPPSMGGYFVSYLNSDKMDVKGFELTVGHRNKLMLGGKPFNYGINANMTYAINRYLKYVNDSPNIPDWRKHVGRSVDANYGWIAEGLYKTEDEISNSAWYGTRPNIGDIKYKDLNGDGKIDDNDRALIGRSNRPRLTFGADLNCSWNGFDMDAQFTGGTQFDVSLTGTYYNGNDDNTVWTQTFKEGANSPIYLVKNAYSEANPNGTFPRITVGNLSHGGDNGLASTFWLRNGRYIRLKSAQLGYSLPRTLLAKVNIQGLRLFVQGSNIFTIDGLPKGIDPESPRVNNGYYPQQRTYMGGVTLTF
jgi:TonB-linked SusC/RagA family outer membrane protein